MCNVNYLVLLSLFLSLTHTTHTLITRIHPTIISNHAPVSFSLQIESNLKPSQTLCLNISLLKDPELDKIVRREWTNFLETNDSFAGGNHTRMPTPTSLYAIFIEPLATAVHQNTCVGPRTCLKQRQTHKNQQNLKNNNYQLSNYLFSVFLC